MTTDWTDGRALCGLVENLRPGLCPDYLDLPTSNKVENVRLGLDLAEEHLAVPQVIEPEDLVAPDVDERSVMTYLSYFVEPAKEQLLQWIRLILPELDISNFTTDWRDGIALATLMHRLHNKLLPDYETMVPEHGLENLQKAMNEAEYRLGVDKLIKAEDIFDPQVDEMSVITYIAQFKTARLRPLPGECLCSGVGLQKAIVGKPARFVIDGSRAGEIDDKIVVNVKKKDDGAVVVEATTEQKSDGVYEVKYTCAEAGPYEVDVRLANESVPSSPFAVDVYDPTQCRINSVNTRALVRERVEVTVDCSKAGNGKLNVTIDGDEVETRCVGKLYTYAFVPKVAGSTAMGITFNGHPVPDAPIRFDVIDPVEEAARCTVAPASDGNEKALSLGYTSTRYRFTVRAPAAGLLDNDALTVAVQGVATAADVDLIDNGDGTYDVEYVADRPGAYLIQVSLYGKLIPGMPTKLTIREKPMAAKCVFHPDKTKHKISGKTLTFYVDTTNAGAGRLAAATYSQKHEVTKLDCQKVSNGRYKLEFTPKDGKCRYALHVRWARQPIPDTPYVFRVWPGPDASRVVVDGPGLNDGTVDEPGEFRIDTREAGVGLLSVRVRGVKGSFKIHLEHDKSDPRYLNATYNPKEEGDYHISVRWADCDVPGSPFPVRIRDPEAEQKREEEKEKRMQERAERAERRKKKEEMLERKRVEEKAAREALERAMAPAEGSDSPYGEAARVRTLPVRYAKDSLVAESAQAMPRSEIRQSSQSYYQHRPLNSRHRSSSFKARKDAATKPSRKGKKEKKKKKVSKDEEESHVPLYHEFDLKRTQELSFSPTGLPGRKFLTGRRPDVF